MRTNNCMVPSLVESAHFPEFPLGYLECRFPGVMVTYRAKSRVSQAAGSSTQTLIYMQAKERQTGKADSGSGDLDGLVGRGALLVVLSLLIITFRLLKDGSAEGTGVFQRGHDARRMPT